MGGEIQIWWLETVGSQTVGSQLNEIPLNPSFRVLVPPGCNAESADPFGVTRRVVSFCLPLSCCPLPPWPPDVRPSRPMTPFFWLRASQTHTMKSGHLFNRISTSHRSPNSLQNRQKMVSFGLGSLTAVLVYPSSCQSHSRFLPTCRHMPPVRCLPCFSHVSHFPDLFHFGLNFVASGSSF